MSQSLPSSIAVAAIAVWSALFAAVSGAGERLHVGPGETHQLPATQADAVFDEWILEDGATLQLPGGVEQWRIEVRKASIGKKVRIVGVGGAGIDGAAGRSHSDVAETCRPGKAGGPGSHGVGGGSGATFNLTLGIAKIDDLTINVSGGKGGNGGVGGNGQAGGGPENCAGGDGGSGGDGGDGGDGGNGGNVRLYYSFLPGNGVDSGIGTRVAILNQPGEPGEPGKGGVGGKGSKGHYVQMHTLSGNQKWIPGGEPGEVGQTGKTGRAGVKGQGAMERDLSQRIDELMRERRPQGTTPPAATDTTLKALEAKVDELLRRIEVLEKPRR